MGDVSMGFDRDQPFELMAGQRGMWHALQLVPDNSV
jgi:hypothetical protein